jgi:hypothetical protein
MYSHVLARAHHSSRQPKLRSKTRSRAQQGNQGKQQKPEEMNARDAFGRERTLSRRELIDFGQAGLKLVRLVLRF